MFGFGREARLRRDATELVRVLLEIAANSPLYANEKPVTAPRKLANMLKIHISGSSTGTFMGEKLPSMSKAGLAVEALGYGCMDNTLSMNDRKLSFRSIFIVLSSMKNGTISANAVDHEIANTILRMIYLKGDFSELNGKALS